MKTVNAEEFHNILASRRDFTLSEDRTFIQDREASRAWGTRPKFDTKINFYGHWGAIKVGNDRFYWMADAHAWGDLGDGRIVLEGVSDTLSQADADCSAAILEALPNGGVFMCRAGAARARYSAVHAKKTKFADSEAWREKFPFWRSKTHVYMDNSYLGDYGEWNRIHVKMLIASVSDKYVTVLLSRDTDTKVSVDRITRKDCVKLNRVELETEGNAWSSTVRNFFYVEEPAFTADRLGAAMSPAEIKSELKDLRRAMQETHPDRGGDVEEFRAAKVREPLNKSNLTGKSLLPSQTA